MSRWHLGRFPIRQLAWMARGDEAGLAIAHGSTDDGWPEYAVMVVDVESGRIAHRLAAPETMLSCGGCHWLDRERLLVSWATRSGVLLEAWHPASDVRQVIADEAIRAVMPSALCSADARARYVVTVTQGGASLRETAGPDAKVSTTPKGIAVRRKNPAPRPWEERQRYTCETDASYAMVALAPDASRLFWATDRGTSYCLDRVSGDKQWHAYMWGGLPGKCRAFDIGFDPTSAFVAALFRHSIEIEGGWRDERTLLIYDAVTGERRLPAVEAATTDVTAFAFRPDGARLAIGTVDGSLVVVSFPGGKIVSRARVFEGERVTRAIYAGQRLVVGSAAGEVAVLDGA